jgi:hypothetical protein
MFRHLFIRHSVVAASASEWTDNRSLALAATRLQP